MLCQRAVACLLAHPPPPTTTTTHTHTHTSAHSNLLPTNQWARVLPQASCASRLRCVNTRCSVPPKHPCRRLAPPAPPPRRAAWMPQRPAAAPKTASRAQPPAAAAPPATAAARRRLPSRRRLLYPARHQPAAAATATAPAGAAVRLPSPVPRLAAPRRRWRRRWEVAAGTALLAPAAGPRPARTSGRGSAPICWCGCRPAGHRGGRGWRGSGEGGGNAIGQAGAGAVREVRHGRPCPEAIRAQAGLAWSHAGYLDK